MVHQYESDDKRTGLEIKYTDFSSKYADPKEALRVAHDVIDPPHLDDKNKKSLPEKINPNPRFVESYNQRVAKEEEEARKVAERKKYNQKGELKAEIYLKEDFQSLHDPLGIFAKKGNYEDLAWKVYRDTKDNEIFLKTLYYPNLALNHYNVLIDNFLNESKSLNRGKRLSYLSALGVFGLTWAFAYRFSLRLPSMVVGTIGGTLASAYLIRKCLTNRSNDRLNSFAKEVAEKYPEIKFSRIEYVKNQ